MSVIASRFVIGRHEAISPFCRQCDSVLIYSISTVPHCVAISQQAFAVIARNEAISPSIRHFHSVGHCEARSNLILFPSFPFYPSFPGTKQFPKKDCRENINIHLNNKHQLVFSRNDVKKMFRRSNYVGHCDSFRHCEARSNLPFYPSFPFFPSFPGTKQSASSIRHCHSFRHCEARSNLILFPSFPFFPSFPGTKQFPKKDCRENINIHLNNKHQLVFSRNDVKKMFPRSNYVRHCHSFRHCEARSNLPILSVNAILCSFTVFQPFPTV